MTETLEANITEAGYRQAFSEFFTTASKYILGDDSAVIESPELRQAWSTQRDLDELVKAIASGDDTKAIKLVRQLEVSPSVRVGIFAKFMEADREPLVDFVVTAISADTSLGTTRFNGRSLLHHAASHACAPIVHGLLKQGIDANILDEGGHTPLYRVASSQKQEHGAQIIKELIRAGADVNHAGGVSRSTALHQAARFGNVLIAKTLIEAGANAKALDRKGISPLVRAIKCRRQGVVDLLTKS